MSLESPFTTHRRDPPAVRPTARHGVLMDRQGRRARYLRISVTDRCNYRCTYCMPEHRDFGPRSSALALEEIVQLCRAFASWGISRVRLTGGEPTVRRGIVELVRELARIPTPEGHLEIVMTTNGDRLVEQADALAEAGLRSVTVSLDSLNRERFRAVTRGADLDRVLAGIDASAKAGMSPIKLNTVAMRGFNDDELAALARFAWDRGCVPRFIELMPMGGGDLFAPGKFMPAGEVRTRIASDLGASLERDEDGDGEKALGPASYWRVREGPHADHRLGTIGAITEDFCASCNRLRISGTGGLHACLARDEHGDLRAALRSGDPERLGAVVRGVLIEKQDGHGFRLDGSGGPCKSMVSIGG